MSLANLSESKGSKALHCCTIMAAGPVPVKTHSMSPWKAFAGQHRSSSHMTVYANRWFGLLNPIVPASVALADSTTTAFLASVALALAPPGDTGGMPHSTVRRALTSAFTMTGLAHRHFRRKGSRAAAPFRMGARPAASRDDGSHRFAGPSVPVL